MAKKKAKKKVVEATGAAVSSRDPNLAARLETAQAEAVEAAIKDGVGLSDTEEILRRKKAARDAVLAEARGA